jgi:hypothetical protein
VRVRFIMFVTLYKYTAKRVLLYNRYVHLLIRKLSKQDGSTRYQIYISSTYITKMLTSQQAAVLIQRKWKRYIERKSLKTLLKRIEVSQSRVKSLELYQHSIIHIHASKINLWKITRLNKAARIIQKAWKIYHGNLMIEEHKDSEDNKVNIIDNYSPVNECDLDIIEELILSKISAVVITPVTYSELDKLLLNRYDSKFEIGFAKGMEELKLCESLVNSIEVDNYAGRFVDCVNLSDIEEHERMLDWAKSPWWIQMLDELES